MDKLDQKRQLLKDNQNKLTIYKNRAYINKNVMLLKDYIAQEINNYTYKFEQIGYEVEVAKSDIDKISTMIFKPKNRDEIKRREEQDIWESGSILSLLPQDTVVDTSSKFAYQYNFRNNISSKYFLLKSSGIKADDIENNSYERPIVYRKTNTEYKINTIITYPKVTVIRYYYKGRQITKQSAYKEVIRLKKNIEEVTYKIKTGYRTIYIDTKTDKQIAKKNAFEIVKKLKRGVRIVESKVRGKKEQKTIKKRKYQTLQRSVIATNMFAQTYTSYLPYYLFVRLARKVLKDDDGEEYIEDTLKFYVSTYVNQNGITQTYSGIISNGHDIQSNSDMFGKVAIEQLFKGQFGDKYLTSEGKIRTEKNNEGSFYADIPIKVLFFIGVKNYSVEKKKQAIKDIDIVNDMKIKDTSSLDINRSKKFIVSDRVINKDFKNILANNKEYNDIVADIMDLEDYLQEDKILRDIYKEARVKKVTSQNLMLLMGICNDRINELNEDIRNTTREQKAIYQDQRDYYLRIKNRLDYLDNFTGKREQEKMIDRFNKEHNENYQAVNTKKLIELKSKKQYIEDNIINLGYSGKVNLLELYRLQVIEEIKKVNPIIL